MTIKTASFFIDGFYKTRREVFQAFVCLVFVFLLLVFFYTVCVFGNKKYLCVSAGSSHVFEIVFVCCANNKFFSELNTNILHSLLHHPRLFFLARIFHNILVFYSLRFSGSVHQ